MKKYQVQTISRKDLRISDGLLDLLIQDYFKYGSIYIDHRKDNHKSDLARYCVRSLDDLINILIPFFEENQLNTNKKVDFAMFCTIVMLLSKNVHLSENGIEQIKTLANKINRKNIYSYESSETVRRDIYDSTCI